MDLSFTAEENAFRQAVRTFVEAKLPADIRQRTIEGKKQTHDDYKRWHRLLHERGWGAPTWPKEYGGPGWGAVEQYIFEEESAAGGAPQLSPFGLKMVGPVIYTFGSDDQRKRFLPRIRSAEHSWCQGYSEPGSGSDLASLKTRAERRGDEYVVNGQKTWITHAQYADFIFCLVRTDPKAKQQSGISFLLIDMKTPGITVRPIVTMDGGKEINEVFFEDVHVPVENRVGEENAGWTYAKFLLGHERTNIAGVALSKRELRKLKRMAAEERKNGKPLIEDAAFAARIAQVEIELWALEITNLRVVSAEREKRAPGPEASLLKIKGTEIQQALTELMMLAGGPSALALENDADAFRPAAAYCNMRKTSIYGGSNEIQKNIISRTILGL